MLTFACSRCRRAGFTADEMSPTGEFRKSDGTPILSWCRECRAKYNREWYERVSRDPVAAAARRASNRESKARRAATPEGRQRMREVGRESSRRRKSDPEKRELDNRRRREARARLKAEDPEAFAALLAKERAQREARRKDPAVRRNDLEARRIWMALRREERGALGAGTPRGEVLTAGERMGGLPVGPLVKAIENWLDGRGYEEVEAFLDPRNLRDWRNGKVAAAHFDIADRVLIGIDLLWWEVWSEGQPGYERAAELFTGEKVAA